MGIQIPTTHTCQHGRASWAGRGGVGSLEVRVRARPRADCIKCEWRVERGTKWRGEEMGEERLFDCIICRN